MSVSDRRLLLTTAIAAVVLAIGTSLLSPNPSAPAEQGPTTYSSASGGAKAAYLLLTRLGYRVRRWEQPLDGLATEGPATMILAEPEMGALLEERQALGRFLAQGGRLIATGDSSIGFLEQHAIVPDVGSSVPARLKAITPSRFARAAPEISMAPSASWRDGEPTTIPLYGDDHLRAVSVPLGRGELIWWAAPTPLTNAGLREAGNLEFFLESVGGTDREVIWNEYVHGHKQNAVSGTTIFLMWLGLHGAVAAAALVFTFSRRSGPIVEPAVEHRLSPLEFVRTLGAVYERAGAASVVVDVAYRRVIYQLARRLGLPLQTPGEQLATAAAHRWRVDPAEIQSVLAACEAARTDADLRSTDALSLVRRLFTLSSSLALFGPATLRTSPEETV